MRKGKDDPHALTERESEVLRSTTVPAELRSFVARQHEQVGPKVTAYQKVAALARAEREALCEIRALRIVKGENGEAAEETEQEIARLRQVKAELEEAVREQRAMMTAKNALPALAEHSNARRY